MSISKSRSVHTYDITGIFKKIDELLEIVDSIPTLSEAATRIRQVQSSFSAEEMDRMMENYCN